jgi:hypothetical protein
VLRQQRTTLIGRGEDASILSGVLVCTAAKASTGEAGREDEEKGQLRLGLMMECARERERERERERRQDTNSEIVIRWA